MSDESDRYGRNSSPPDYDFRDFEPIPKEEPMISRVVIRRIFYLALSIISLYLRGAGGVFRSARPTSTLFCCLRRRGKRSRGRRPMKSQDDFFKNHVVGMLENCQNKNNSINTYMQRRL
jgi:hypothetical protein